MKTESTESSSVRSAPALAELGRQAGVNGQRGTTLLELIVVSGIVGLVLTLGFPLVGNLSGKARLDAAGSEVSAVLRRAHQEARMQGHNVGLKFFPQDDGRGTYALFEDGDGDGVRNNDIRSGTDPQLTPRVTLQHLGSDIRFGIPIDHEGNPPRAPNSRQRLDRVSDPIRFNRSDIASFAAGGTATPGTIYLTDGHRALAVRVRNQTGKVQVLRYDRSEEIWR